MLNIEMDSPVKLLIPYEDIITKTVEAAAEYVKCPYEVEVNVLLVDNDSIREINKDQRDIDAPTDVLSFPMVDFHNPEDFDLVEKNPIDYFNSETGELLYGDIVISTEKVISQAEEYGHSEERELAFLVAHSMLHLSGYDHIDDEERLVMEEKQEYILQKLGYTRD